MAGRLGILSEADGELDELKQDIAPEAVLDEMAAREQDRPAAPRA